MKDINLLKKMILHDNFYVAKFVVDYIVDSGKGDLETSKLTLDAYSKFKNEYDAYNFLYSLSKLPIDSRLLNKIYNLDVSDYNSEYYKNLIITNADLYILKEYPLIRPTKPYFLEILNKRWVLNDMDTTKLWDELWSINTINGNEHAFLIIDELVKRKDFPLKHFKQKMNELHNGLSEVNNKYWDYIVVNKIIGQLQFDEGIPFLLEQLKEGNENIEPKVKVTVVESLFVLGNDNIIKSIQANYFNQTEDYQFSVLELLQKIKLPLCEEVLINLFQKEMDLYKKTVIATALCEQLSTKAIPIIAEFIRDGYDKMYTLLEEDIYYNCLINKVNHSDMKDWENIVKEEKQFQKNRREALSFINKKLDEKNKKPQSIRVKKFELNKPCPCGSGKKYKRCCLGK